MPAKKKQFMLSIILSSEEISRRYLYAGPARALAVPEHAQERAPRDPVRLAGQRHPDIPDTARAREAGDFAVFIGADGGENVVPACAVPAGNALAPRVPPDEGKVAHQEKTESIFALLFSEFHGLENMPLTGIAYQRDRPLICGDSFFMN